MHKESLINDLLDNYILEFLSYPLYLALDYKMEDMFDPENRDSFLREKEAILADIDFGSVFDLFASLNNKENFKSNLNYSLLNYISPDNNAFMVEKLHNKLVKNKERFRNIVNGLGFSTFYIDGVMRGLPGIFAYPDADNGIKKQIFVIYTLKVFMEYFGLNEFPYEEINNDRILREYFYNLFTNVIDLLTTIYSNYHKENPTLPSPTMFREMLLKGDIDETIVEFLFNDMLIMEDEFVVLNNVKHTPLSNTFMPAGLLNVYLTTLLIFYPETVSKNPYVGELYDYCQAMIVDEDCMVYDLNFILTVITTSTFVNNRVEFLPKNIFKQDRFLVIEKFLFAFIKKLFGEGEVLIYQTFEDIFNQLLRKRREVKEILKKVCGKSRTVYFLTGYELLRLYYGYRLDDSVMRKHYSTINDILKFVNYVNPNKDNPLNGSCYFVGSEPKLVLNKFYRYIFYKL